MTLEFWIQSLIPSLLLISLVGLDYKQFGSPLVPSTFFGMYWALCLLVPLLLAPDFYFWPGAAWAILIFAACLRVGVQFGMALGNSKSVLAVRNTKIDVCQFHWGKEIIIACTISGMLSVYFILQSRGYAISSLLSLDIIMTIARDFSVARYSDNFTLPLFVNMLVAPTYLGAILGGAWFFCSKTPRKRLWGLLPFVPAGLQALIMTTRTSLVAPLLFYISTFMAVSVLHPSLWKRWRVKQVIRAGLLLMVAIGVYAGLQILRDALTIGEMNIAIEKSKVGFLGSPSVFSQWFEQTWFADPNPSWGVYSVAGLFNFFGIAPRELGIFPVGQFVGSEGWISNVYTVFRGLIEDFTLPGTLIVLCFIGSIAGFSYKKVSAGKYEWVAVLALFYSFTLWSPLGSIFNYNTFLLSWLLCFIFIGPVGFRFLRARPS